MKKGLMIIGKDVDAYLANHINEQYNSQLNVDIVVLRHRDKLEFKKKFAHIINIYSMPEYAHENSVSYDNLSDDDIVKKIELYSDVYSLRNINRYLHYDFFRAIKKKSTQRNNYIRILSILDFFSSIEISNYDFSYGELSRSYYLICYDIMKGRGKVYLSPSNIGPLKGILYIDDKFQIINFESKRQSFMESDDYQKYIEEARKHIAGFRETPKYNYPFLSTSFTNNFKKLKHVIRKSKNLILELRANRIDSKFRFDYIPKNPFSRVLEREIYSFIKSKLISLFYFRQAKIERNDYIYFPLHVHPETTTSLFSEFSIDHVSQHASTIEYLSKSIPIANKLLVKEHPAMIGYRDLGCYSKYNQFYNVEFVGPKISQYDALNQSEYVVTLCGTVGVEALMLGKKVITLGNAYYNYFRGVKCISGIEEFPHMFKESDEFATDDDLLSEDFAFLMYCTHFGVFNFLIDNDSKVISQENLDLFTKSLIQELAND